MKKKTGKDGIFKMIIIPSLFGGISILVLIAFFQLTIPNMLIFSSMGSSVALIALHPSGRPSRLKIFLSAYLIEIAIGLTFLVLGLTSFIPLAAVGGMVVFLSIFMQRALGTVHTPAVGVGLSFILLGKDYQDFAYLLITVIVLLTIHKLLYYTFHPSLEWEHFHKKEIMGEE